MCPWYSCAGADLIGRERCETESASDRFSGWEGELRGSKQIAPCEVRGSESSCRQW